MCKASHGTLHAHDGWLSGAGGWLCLITVSILLAKQIIVSTCSLVLMLRGMTLGSVTHTGGARARRQGKANGNSSGERHGALKSVGLQFNGFKVMTASYYTIIDAISAYLVGAVLCHVLQVVLQVLFQVTGGGFAIETRMSGRK